MVTERLGSHTKTVRILEIDKHNTFVVSVGEKEHHCLGEIRVSQNKIECPDEWKEKRGQGGSALCVALDILSDELNISRWEAYNFVLESGKDGVQIDDPEDKILEACNEARDRVLHRKAFVWNKINPFISNGEVVKNM